MMRGGGWIRPVSERSDGTLEPHHCEVEGRWPEVFDVVRIHVNEERRTPWHPENWEISGKPWQLVERVDPASTADELREIIDHGARLMESTERTVRADHFREQPLDRSLVLVRPDEDLRWHIENSPWGKKQRKATFTIDNDNWSYDFQVTDIPVEERLKSLPDGMHPRSAVGIGDQEEVFLTISVTEPWEKTDTCSKLVAAVVRTPGDE
jgi:putative nucleic acid modification protein with dual OB domain